MKIENFLSNNGMEIIKVKNTLDQLEGQAKELVLKQFNYNIKMLLMKNLTEEQLAIEMVKKSDIYGSYNDYIVELFDCRISDAGFKDYSISVDKYNKVYVEKVARYNDNFMKKFFNIDLNKLKNDDYQFINQFMINKCNAMQAELDESLNNLHLNVSYENRKVIIKYPIDKNKPEEKTFNEINEALNAIIDIFNKHVYLEAFTNN